MRDDPLGTYLGGFPSPSQTKDEQDLRKSDCHSDGRYLGLSESARKSARKSNDERRESCPAQPGTFRSRTGCEPQARSNNGRFWKPSSKTGTKPYFACQALSELTHFELLSPSFAF